MIVTISSTAGRWATGTSSVTAEVAAAGVTGAIFVAPQADTNSSVTSGRRKPSLSIGQHLEQRARHG